MSSLIIKIKRFMTNPAIPFKYIAQLGFLNFMADDKYLKKLFKLKMGYELNLEHPVTFNEKLQWLKLYDRKPEYSNMVDKYEAKLIAGGVLEDSILYRPLEYGTILMRLILLSCQNSLY